MRVLFVWECLFADFFCECVGVWNSRESESVEKCDLTRVFLCTNE